MPIRLLFRNSEGFSAAFFACKFEFPSEKPSQHETRQSNRIGPQDARSCNIGPVFDEYFLQNGSAYPRRTSAGPGAGATGTTGGGGGSTGGASFAHTDTPTSRVGSFKQQSNGHGRVGTIRDSLNLESIENPLLG